MSARPDAGVPLASDAREGDDGGEAHRSFGAPVVGYQLDPEFASRLAAHETRPRLIGIPSDRPVWHPPRGADVMFTFASAWWQAPGAPPDGWPFDLKWIQLASAGVDAVPRWAYEGTTVTCSRGITARPIAEYVMQALLDDERRPEAVVVASRDDAVRLRDEDLWLRIPIGALHGRTLGLVGIGAIGKAIATRAHAFGMRIVALRRSGAPSPLPFVDLVPDVGTLFGRVDHAVICAPLTPATRGLVSEDALRGARPGLHLVNVARGPLVDHDALGRAIDAGIVRKATLDVTDPEPLPDGHRFYNDPRVRLTPHIAWFSADHHTRLTDRILENLSRYARGGRLTDVVDPVAGY